MELVAEKSQFLYHQLRDYLTMQARNGKMGKNGRIPSERDLADNMKISRGTVRMALSELEKSGFIERIRPKGAFLRQASKKRIIRLALVFPEVAISQHTLDPYNLNIDTEIWHGMLNACLRLNGVLSFTHCSVQGDLNEFEDFARNLSLEYDGALFIGEQLAGLKKVLNARDFPFIALFDNTENIKNNIYCDFAEACEQAGKHLLECGCKNIFLIGPECSSTWLLKKSALRRTFADAGFWIPDENIIAIPGNSEEQCLELLRKRLPASGGKFPDAFFCATQDNSFALLDLANERNWRIPEDFMMISYGDPKLRSVLPLLTHIRIPYFNIGYQGCEILVNSIINGEALSKQTIVNADLIIGKTTYKKSAEPGSAVSREPLICTKINRQEQVYAGHN